MKFTTQVFLLIVSVCLYFSSCGIIMKNVFGFKTIREFDKNKYEKFLLETNRDDLNIYYSISDSFNYIKISNFGLSNKYKSLLLQPMKAYLFENNDLKFFVANCLVPPKLPNLNWNYQSKFEYFPPLSSTNFDSLHVNLQSFQNILPRKLINYKYVYIIDWSLMTKRQSINLINMVYYNIDKFNKCDSTIIIINNCDDFYIKSEVEF